MDIDDFHQWLIARGARLHHRQRVLRAWLQGRALDAGPRRQPASSFLPHALIEQLPALEGWLGALAQVRSVHAAEDGAERLLMALADGQTVETVLLPRDGVCVSSQVGCAVGCRFCMTGQGGLLRQLSSLEIVAQVVQARRRRMVKKVVFMGMGEPAHNLDAVLAAIDLLGREAGLAHKNLVLSTVGDRRVFERLPGLCVRPALALSLHTTRAGLREQLLPRAPRIAPEELVAQCDAYARATGYPIQYQWTLLAGVNDDPAEFDTLARWLRGHYAVVNLIPYNALSGDAPGYSRPSSARIEDICRQLRSLGVLAKVRHSAGQEIDGGCGQLRARQSAQLRRVSA